GLLVCREEVGGDGYYAPAKIRCSRASGPMQSEEKRQNRKIHWGAVGAARRAARQKLWPVCLSRLC
ncbi:hypothetical protein, partial [Acidaminococcus fermentans]|uniref:hypothetical protein n=1 Tax=Acidaminococcus fermentans TaxID=905 RepID=UPI00307A660B